VGDGVLVDPNHPLQRMTTPAGASILGRTGWDGGAGCVDREAER
jgi:hypothetical protein